MAPVVNQAPTALQRGQVQTLCTEDKYKTYVRSNSNPSHQFDDNMKEPKNNPDLKNPSINNNNVSGKYDLHDAAPQFFTCYTSYSCTPTDIPPLQPSQMGTESSQIPILANQGMQQIRFEPNNNQLNGVESGKVAPNIPFNNYNINQHTAQTPQIKSSEKFGHPSQINEMNQINFQKIAESGKPAPHAMLNNVKNPSIVPSPLITINDGKPDEPPRQRKTSNPGSFDRPQGQYGLSHSRSSPAIPSKGSAPSPNESLVLQYFQNPHTQKNPQDKQLTGQGTAQRSMLPPPTPPAARSKSTSPRNSFNAKSVPNAKPADEKSNDWEKVLTKFYQW